MKFEFPEMNKVSFETENLALMKSGAEPDNEFELDSSRGEI